MQRIADRVQREFSGNGNYIEINALDGNGGKPSLVSYEWGNFLIFGTRYFSSLRREAI
jgi:hypothetical protein